MPRRLESLAFYLSANECLIECEGSGVVMADEGMEDICHSLRDGSLAGRALVIQGGPGGDRTVLLDALLEAVHVGRAPALIVLDRVDAIVALAAIVAEEILSHSLPVVVLDAARFAMAQSAHVVTLHRGRQLVLSGPRLAGIASVTGGGELGHEAAPTVAANDGFSLSPEDQRELDGASGAAVQTALRVVLRMARLQGAAALVDVAQVSVDHRFQTGPAGLAVAKRLADWGGRVRVPTTIDTVTRANATESVLEACRRLGATVIDDSQGLPERATLAWPMALCAAITGRVPAPNAE